MRAHAHQISKQTFKNVYNRRRLCYNLAVKKTAALILCLITALVAGGGAAAAYAETGIQTYATEATVYPDLVSELEVGVDYYAATDGEFAIVSETTLYIYSYTSCSPSDEGYTFTGYLDTYEHSSAITAAAYDDGELIFSSSNGVFSYSDGTVAATDKTITASANYVFDEKNSVAYQTREGALLIFGFGLDDSISYNDADYTLLSQTDDGIYVLKGNKLCAIVGTDVVSITIEYTDSSHGASIGIGDDVREALTTAPDGETNSVTFATVYAGNYVTQIDLSDISGQYFVTGDKGTFALDSDAYALVLCKLDEAAIVAVGGETYITSPSALGADVYAATSDVSFSAARLNYPAGLYSSPFICDATRLLSLETGAAVEVLYEIKADEQTDGSALTTDFCLVKYTDGDGNAVCGYIPTSFLTEYDFAAENGEFETTVPEDYSEDDVVVTVVLVIIVVVLVIAGVAYLAYFSGSEKRRKRERGEYDGRDYEVDDGDDRQ